METSGIKKIKVNRKTLESFADYLREIAAVHFNVSSKTLGHFLQFHYEQLMNKILSKGLFLLSKKKDTAVISLNYAEVNCLSYFFNLHPATGLMLVIQNLILDGLTLE